MIHVAIACAANSLATGRICPPLEGTVPLADVTEWHAAQIADHAWTVDDTGNTYCPKHNPADIGTPITLTSEAYLPIGDSGWEARALVPEGSRLSVSLASIEIRQRRGNDDD